MKKIIILIAIIFLCGCSVMGLDDEEDIINYLNDKYGDDIEFTPMYTSSCKVYEAGTCRASFTSSITGENEIHIIWNKKDGSDLRDDFLFLKYDKEFKEYYTNIIKNDIDGKFTISEITNRSDYLWDKDLPFNEFIKYENLNTGIAINIANEELDLNVLAETLKETLINSDNKNVASLYLTSFNDSCNLDDVSSCEKINSIYFEVKIVEFFDENAKKS